MSRDHRSRLDQVAQRLTQAVPADLGSDGPWTAVLQQRLARQTKPPGSLGRIEALALQVGSLQRTGQPVLASPQLVVFAGDHGLAHRGVSAYPREVTWQMVENMRAGGAAVNVLARQHGLGLTVVDAGVDHDFEPDERRHGGDDPPPAARLVGAKVARGTADASLGPAMTPAQCAQALAAGADVVGRLPGRAVLLGEMGIGNTSSASLLMARLAGWPLSDCVGRGTGLDEAGLARKTAVLAQALESNAAARTPVEALAAFGGFEIAMLVGALLQAAAERRLVVVDGFIVGSAALVALALCPAARAACVFAHRGREAGHARLLETLRASPLLDLELRLGEGSGAALAWPIVASSLELLDGMATFESAGVADRPAPGARP
jgi:nicotinate-nucleotide--dimethylbenzimidazole phosphoribosyltransferase